MLVAAVAVLASITPATAHSVRSSASHHRLRAGEGGPLTNETSLGRHLTEFEGLLENVGAGLFAGEFEKPSGKLPIGKNLQCGVPSKVHSGSDKWVRCPDECPLFAQQRGNEIFCDFTCVPASVDACKASNPKEPIVDLKRGICRECWQAGCETCAKDGTDTCQKCAAGFTLTKEGTCSNQYFLGWATLFTVLFLLLILIGLWMFDLWRRPITNKEGLKWGLDQRSRAKLHMPRSDEETEGHAHRGFWPLLTNLCWQQVAGPGILLQFNFQFIIIVWAAGVSIAWYIMAMNTHAELLELGTHEAGTPRQNCIVVAFGYEMQQELMWAKIDFTIGLYICSFILSLLHGVRQLRMFQSMDSDNTTHKDFAARCYPLPKVTGEIKVEEELTKLMAEATEQAVVGASVSWDYGEKEEKFLDMLEDDLKERETGKPVAKSVAEALAESQLDDEKVHEARLAEEATEESESAEVRQPPRKMVSNAEIAVEAYKRKSGYVFRKFESLFLHPATQKMLTRGGAKVKKKNFHEEDDQPGMVQTMSSAAKRAAAATPRGCCGSREREGEEAAEEAEEAPEDEEEEEFDIDKELLEMNTTYEAFIVFETEESRDLAIKALTEKGGVEYRGAQLNLFQCACEPDTVLWPNLAVDSLQQKAIRGCLGVGAILIALAFWAITFYLPYAYFVVFSSSFDHGNEPDFVAGFTFSMVVVLGNALMYLVCSEVADRIGLHYIDDREVVYMLLYAFACVSNVALDIATTYVMAYMMMVGQDMRTYGGVHLRDITTFTDRFETYAMQRALGEQLMAYSWPSTFFVPFVLEPIGTIFAPYKLMTFLIRSHSEITADEAEGYLGSLVMDLSRYADLMLNVMLAALVFFFPGGFVVPMFSALAFSHCWIYLVDHYRVLRVVRKCNYAAMSVDWWAQWMLSLPLGFLAATLVFKGNCQSGYLGLEREPPFCLDGVWLLSAMGIAFAGHVALHTVLLLTVVPALGKADNPPTEETYRQCAEQLACSWFTANPIFCLRSKYVYNHEPPCDFCVVGKEHLLRKNEAIGQFFQDEQAEVEDFDKAEAMGSNLLKNFRRSTSRLLGARRESDASQEPGDTPRKETVNEGDEEKDA